MEDLRNIEELEQAAQPDLLEAFASREVTIFGITGTFKDLAGMCPVDLNDPRITLEAKNEFVVKAANEAGLEVEPEHEELFSRITERHGLEKKFTVAAPRNNLATESKPTIQLGNVRNKNIVASTSKLRDEQLPVQTPEQRIISNELPEENKPSQPVRRLPRVSIPLPAITEIYNASLRNKPMTEHVVYMSREQAQAPQVPPLVVEKTKMVAQEVANYDEETIFAVDELGINIVDDAINEILATSQPEAAIEPLPATARQETLEVPKVDWATELSKEPLDVYEDFTEALRIFAELPTIPVIAAQEADLGDSNQPSNAEMEKPQPMPAILTTVAERLAELEPNEKELVAPILKNLVGAIHGMQLLEAREADQETIVAVEAQLQELCVALFEAIGIDYNEQAIKQFMGVMLHPDFEPPQPEVQEVRLDLEYVGTREAKWHFPQFTSGIADVERQIHHMLGNFALFCCAQ